ncbi:hypothetical protein, partial [Mycobacterium szulgai]|uniref:hypothetical protein n=1 Tax=Mycobacterium szulgai TaxID=1787 RepID=UPI0027E2FFD6
GRRHQFCLAVIELGIEVVDGDHRHLVFAQRPANSVVLNTATGAASFITSPTRAGGCAGSMGR